MTGNDIPPGYRLATYQDGYAAGFEASRAGGTPDDVRAAAERLIDHEDRHIHIRNGSEDVAVDCADILTVARFVLTGDTRSVGATGSEKV